MRKQILRQWLQIVWGLFVFSFGVHLTIYANIGLAPWDCLGMGIARQTPLNYGLSMTAMAVVVLLLDVLMGEKIGFGTVIDALLTGNFTQLFNTLNPLPENENIFLGAVVMLIGLSIMAYGQYLHMRTAQGCGPRDALLVGLGKRLPRLPIGAVEILLLGFAVLTGWLLGGPVGIGTVISTFGTGIVMQLVYNAVHFEPREVRHKGILEVTRILLGHEEAKLR